jgi:hypothetical protein
MTISIVSMVTPHKWLYNTTYHGATHMTPFEAVYGQNPPSILSYLLGVSKVQEVERTLIVMDEIVDFNLVQ